MVSIVNQLLPHADQEGPRNLTGKEDVVKYLKDVFAREHKAIGTQRMRTCWNRYAILTPRSSGLRDSMRRQFSSHTLGFTTGKWWNIYE